MVSEVHFCNSYWKSQGLTFPSVDQFFSEVSMDGEWLELLEIEPWLMTSEQWEMHALNKQNLI